MVAGRPFPDSSAPEPPASALDQSDDDQKDHGTDCRIDYRSDDPGAECNPELRKHPAPDQRTDNPDRHVPDQTQSGASNYQASQPSSNQSNEKYDQKAFSAQLDVSSNVPGAEEQSRPAGARGAATGPQRAREPADQQWSRARTAGWRLGSRPPAATQPQSGATAQGRWLRQGSLRSSRWSRARALPLAPESLASLSIAAFAILSFISLSRRGDRACRFISAPSRRSSCASSAPFDWSGTTPSF